MHSKIIYKECISLFLFTLQLIFFHYKFLTDNRTFHRRMPLKCICHCRYYKNVCISLLAKYHLFAIEVGISFVSIDYFSSLLIHFILSCRSKMKHKLVEGRRRRRQAIIFIHSSLATIFGHVFKTNKQEIIFLAIFE